ncbi:MAG TPA: hypothetical protein VK034_01365 [Enhygromyxa sp.]|nr:hypothetical protein [Enhygromyxa sp.]
MSDRHVLIDGDTVEYSGFAPANVIVQPGTLKGSGPGTIDDKPICVDGDQGSAKVENVSYSLPSYESGSGTLEIVTLAPDQTASKTRTGKKPVLLVGSECIAQFTVETPASGPDGPAPKIKYPGIAVFKTNNNKFRGV